MSLEKFFYPKSVVIIGASRKQGHVGNVIAKNFAERFKGEVYFVNPKGGELFGKPLYKSIDEIPADEIDMAVIVVPAKIVPAVMRELPKKKVKAVVVISGGFAEIGEEGRKRQEEIVKIAKEHGMRIIGPNCIGVYVPETGVDTIFLPEEKLKRPGDGHTAFITQSGAFGASFLDYIAHMGRGISKFISFGNAADVNEMDLLNYLKDDPKTRVIAAYLEGFRDGRGFFEAAKEASKKKPIIVIKANRNPTGAKAAKSHTAALATDDAVVEGMFKQAHIIRAYTRDEAYDYILAFELLDRPVKGKRVQVVTNGGGAGVMTCDAIGDYGLELAQLSEETYKKLRETFPEFYVVGNPIDITGSARADDYIIALKHVIPDPNNDAIVLIVLPSVPALDLEELKEKLEKEIFPLMKEYKKPIFAVSMGGEQAEEFKRRLIAHGIPTYDEPDKAVRALAAYMSYWLRDRFFHMYIGALRRRREFVLNFFKDFDREIESKSRRIVSVDRKNKKLIGGSIEDLPHIIIPRKDKKGNYYMTIRIIVDHVVFESDYEDSLLPVLFALRDPTGFSLPPVGEIVPVHIPYMVFYEKKKKGDEILLSPYLRMYGSGRIYVKIFIAMVVGKKRFPKQG